MSFLRWTYPRKFTHSSSIMLTILSSPGLDFRPLISTVSNSGRTLCLSAASSVSSASWETGALLLMMPMM